MDIRFLGATQTVTGSKTLVNTEGGAWLVDCGLYQGFKSLRKRNRAEMPFSVNELTGIALTHAHLDHSGLVPLLAKQGYRQPVYCTEATAELCKLLWPDSGYLMEEEAHYANKRKLSRHDPAQPLYTKADAEQALKLLKPVPQDSSISVAGIQLNFQSAGHILGASSIYLTEGGVTAGFSGDLGGATDAIMFPPRPPLATDCLVVESTYGDRLTERANIQDDLTRVINEVAKRGGTLLIPSFAVGRAQLLMHLITQLQATGQVPQLPVYVDSPMAINASQLYIRFQALHKLDDSACDEMFCDVQYTRTTDESKALVASTFPKIIISASGMATGGRVLHHLKNLLPDHRNAVLLVGYQAEGSRGDRLARGEKTIKIHGQYHPVKASVEMMHGFSAHADQQELLNWLSSAEKPPGHVFLNHGGPRAADTLRLKIEEQLGWQVDVPDYGDRYTVGNAGCTQAEY